MATDTIDDRETMSFDAAYAEVGRHIRAVAAKIASQPIARYVDRNDLEQIGLIELMKKLPSYRPDRGPLWGFVRARIMGAMTSHASRNRMVKFAPRGFRAVEFSSIVEHASYYGLSRESPAGVAFVKRNGKPISERSAASGAVEPTRNAAAESFRESVSRYVDLTPDEWEILRSVFVDGQTVTAVAHRLALTVSKVTHILNRIRGEIRFGIDEAGLDHLSAFA